MIRRSSATLTWDDRTETPPDPPASRLRVVERVSSPQGDVAEHGLVQGDNLAALQALVALGYAGQVGLVYLDPPFVSDALYEQRLVLPNGQVMRRPAFKDAWPSLDHWLAMLYPRLRLLYTLLADTGSLYLHLDWRAVHYARVLLDEIFGPDQFRNEIVWRRAASLGRKAASGQYGRVTDTLLFYSKSDAFVFHRMLVEREIPRRGAHWDAERRRWFRTAPPGDYTEASLAQLAAEGRIHTTRTGRRRVKYYLDETADGRLVDHVPLDNLWLDIPDMMHLPPAERTGYPTQKPLALLRRIVTVSSNPGDLVLDPFAGAGTTIVAAATLGRRWLGLDASPAGIAVARARLLAVGAAPFTVYEVAEAGARESVAPTSVGKEAPQGSAAGEGRPVAPTSVGKEAPHVGATGQGGIQVEMVTCDAGLLVRLSGETDELEYWAVDWDYDGEFRSRWQARRDYSRRPTPLPTQVTLPLNARPRQVAVRWETLSGGANWALV